MKTFSIFFIFSLFLFSTSLLAQVPDPDMSAVEAAMTEGVNKCTIVEIADINKKEAEKIWQDYSKKRLGKKSKKIKKANVYLTDNASVRGMSGKQRVFTSFRESGNDTEMRIWVDNGNGFIDPENHPSDYNAVKEMLISYNRSVEKYRVELELKGEEKVLKSLEKDLKGLKKEKDKLESDIKKNEKKIDEAEDRIVENGKEQKAKTADIKMQSDIVAAVENRLGGIDGDLADEKDRVESELKEEGKTMKSLKKDLKKLKKEKSRLKSDIKKYEKKIKKAEERIPENEKEQEAKAAEIKIQSGVIDEVKDRLGKIDY